jgi:hypothetical protein
VNIGDKVDAPHPQNWMADETMAATIVSITPERTIPRVDIGTPAVVEAMATVRYEDGSMSGPLALSRLTPRD